MLRPLLALALALAAVSAAHAAPPHRTPAQIDAEVARAMAGTGAKGLALAVIENGRVAYVKAYGVRNAKGEPLTTDTVMYGASLTKAVVAYTTMKLVDDRAIDLDRPLASYLAKPLPDYPEEDRYAPWQGLADDPRWRKITARHVLTHSTGFANFAFLEPDRKLRIHFEPGSRYAYSGEGFILLQFVLERGMGLDLGRETQARVFEPLGLTRTSLVWRPDFARNLADGWDAAGKPQAHDERSRVRAAGSMDTTIADFARFAAAFVRGQGLSRRAAAEMLRPQLPITTRGQFPTVQPELPPAARRPDLAAGLGVVVFDGPQGAGFYKGGHDDITGNSWVCVERRKSCVVLLSNDVRAEAAYPALVRFILGQTGVPYAWEYGDLELWR